MKKVVSLYVDNCPRRQSNIANCLNSAPILLNSVFRAHEVQTSMEAIRPQLVMVHSHAIGEKDLCGFCTQLLDSSLRLRVLVVLMEKFQPDLEKRLFNCGVYDVVVAEQASPGALAHRIQSHIRHCGLDPQGRSNRTVRLGEVAVDFSRNEVLTRGKTKKLPGILADLLKYFMSNPSRIITRGELEHSRIWEDSICTSAKDGGKTIDVTIGKLRRIVERNPHKPKVIQTVRGVGWKLARTVMQEAS